MDTPAGRLAANQPKRATSNKNGWTCTARKYRNLNDLTLAAVGKALGIHLGHLSQLENLKSLPSLDTAYKLAHFYGVKVDDLWTYTQPSSKG